MFSHFMNDAQFFSVTSYKVGKLYDVQHLIISSDFKSHVVNSSFKQQRLF